MTDERILYISTGRSIFDNTIYSNSFTWLDFINTIKNFRVINYSVEEYKKLDKQEKHKLKDTGYFIFGKFSKNLRRKEFLINREGLTLDFDDVTYKDMTDTLNALKQANFNYCLYTTASYDGANGKFRVIVPFNEPVEPKEYSNIAKEFVRGRFPKIDEASFNVSQAFNFPTRLSDIKPVFEFRSDGNFVNPNDYKKVIQEDITTIKANKINEKKAIDIVTNYVKREANNLLDRNNYLSALMVIIKTVQQGAISENLGGHLAMLLANGNSEWEKENLKQFNRELRNTVPTTTLDFYSKFDFGNSSNEINTIVKVRKGLTAKKLNGLDLPPIIFYVDKLIPQGIGWLAGESKVGKSYLAVQMLHAIATGKDFLNYKTNKTTVIYYSLEMADNLNQTRNRQLFDGEFPDNFILYFDLPPYDNGLFEQLRNDIALYNAKVVVIDIHGRVAMDQSAKKSLYLQSYKEMGQYKKLADELDLSIILITHLNKGGIGIGDFDRVMGSVGNRGATDFNILLSHDLENKGRYIYKEESRKSESTELVLERDSTGRFYAIGTVYDLMKQNEYKNFISNNIVKSIIDLMGTSKKIEVSATDILENIPDGQRFDEKMEELTARKIGHRMKKLIPKFKKYKGWVISRGKRADKNVFVIQISINEEKTQ